jgi:type II secretory pathway pseudopilin PulG
MKKNRQMGVTLTELLVYMALLSIFLVVLLDIFTTTLKTKLSTESTSALNQDSRYIFAKLSSDIGNADSIITPTLGATSGSLQLSSGGATNTYALSNGDLLLTSGGTSMKLNSLDTSLDNISFKNVGNVGGKPTIQVSFTVRSKVILAGVSPTQSVAATVGLR